MPSEQLTIDWKEIGGPPMDARGKSNYGSSVITDLVPYELGGTADLVFAPDGVAAASMFPANGYERAVNGLASRPCWQSLHGASSPRPQPADCGSHSARDLRSMIATACA